MGRTLVKYFPAMEWMEPCIPSHIPHQYSQQMESKSQIFPLKVIFLRFPNTIIINLSWRKSYCLKNLYTCMLLTYTYICVYMMLFNVSCTQMLWDSTFKINKWTCSKPLSFISSRVWILQIILQDPKYYGGCIEVLNELNRQLMNSYEKAFNDLIRFWFFFFYGFIFSIICLLLF